MHVVLTTTEQGWLRWAQQYVKRQPQARKFISVAPGLNPTAAKDELIKAIKLAGTDGMLAISVGHGASVDGASAEGIVELSPGGTLVLVGRNVRPAHSPTGAAVIDVFYDTRADPTQPSDFEFDTKNNPQAQRLKNWHFYQDICKAMKDTKPYRVVFLTCRVGNATEFLRKIANDWGVVINAYTKRVACTEDVYTFGGKSVTTSYVHLQGEVYPSQAANGGDSNVIAAEELPYRPANNISIGPPLPPPR